MGRVLNPEAAAAPPDTEHPTSHPFAGFAGLLHALTAGIQILIRAVPLDVAEDADQLLAAAEHLPHPALAAAARDHAGFLHELAAGHELLW